MDDPAENRRTEWLLQAEIWRSYVCETAGEVSQDKAEKAKYLSARLGAEELLFPVAKFEGGNLETDEKAARVNVEVENGTLAFHHEELKVARAPEAAVEWLTPLLEKKGAELEFFAVNCDEVSLVVVAGVPGAICLRAIEDATGEGTL